MPDQPSILHVKCYLIQKTPSTPCFFYSLIMTGPEFGARALNAATDLKSAGSTRVHRRRGLHITPKQRLPLISQCWKWLKEHGGCTKSIFHDKVQVRERKGHRICILMYSTASAPGKQGGIGVGLDLYWFDGDDTVSHLRFGT